MIRIFAATFTVTLIGVWALVAFHPANIWRSFPPTERSDVWLYTATHAGDVRVHLRHASFAYTASEDCFGEPSPSLDVGRTIGFEITSLPYAYGTKYVAQISLAYPVAISATLLLLTIRKSKTRQGRFEIVVNPAGNASSKPVVV